MTRSGAKWIGMIETIKGIGVIQMIGTIKSYRSDRNDQKDRRDAKNRGETSLSRNPSRGLFDNAVE